MVFRLAFAGFIVIELIVWVFLLAGVSKLFSEDNFVVGGILGSLLFVGVFGIGALSYFIFQRMTRTQYVLIESEKWRAERHSASHRKGKLRNMVIRQLLWAPTFTVVLACLLMDYTWPLASHLFHPGSGRLIGYDVSIPFTWSIAYGDSRSPNGKFSIVVAERYRGLIKAGSGLYLGRRPPFSVSSMNFRSIPAVDELAAKPGANVISIQRLPLGEDGLECREEIPPEWTHSENYIHCSTTKGDFSANFSGAAEDVDEFYRVLRSVKRKD